MNRGDTKARIMKDFASASEGRRIRMQLLSMSDAYLTARLLSLQEQHTQEHPEVMVIQAILRQRANKHDSQ